MCVNYKLKVLVLNTVQPVLSQDGACLVIRYLLIYCCRRCEHRHVVTCKAVCCALDCMRVDMMIETPRRATQTFQPNPEDTLSMALVSGNSLERCMCMYVCFGGYCVHSSKIRGQTNLGLKCVCRRGGGRMVTASPDHMTIVYNLIVHYYYTDPQTHTRTTAIKNNNHDKMLTSSNIELM